jgi:hypothetical protein
VRGGGRVRCERIIESVCQECFEQMVDGAGSEAAATLTAFIEMDDDPLLQWRARKRLTQLSGAVL